MTRLAEAYEALAEAAAAVALEIRATASPDAPGAPSFEELPFDEYDSHEAATLIAAEGIQKAHGSLAQCPAHHTPYKDGRYGPFCPQPSQDPKWSNDRGYCVVTPAKAAAYLRQKAAA
jgi:hypothetical protein